MKYIKLYEEFLLENQLEKENIFKLTASTDSYLNIKDFFKTKLGDDFDNEKKKNKLFDDADVELIHIDDIIPNQDYLRMPQVNRNVNKPLKKKPMGVKLENGNVILFDGHHRVAGEILKGAKTIEMKILNYSGTI